MTELLDATEMEFLRRIVAAGPVELVLELAQELQAYRAAKALPVVTS